MNYGGPVRSWRPLVQQLQHVYELLHSLTHGWIRLPASKFSRRCTGLVVPGIVHVTVECERMYASRRR